MASTWSRTASETRGGWESRPGRVVRVPDEADEGPRLPGGRQSAGGKAPNGREEVGGFRLPGTLESGQQQVRLSVHRGSSRSSARKPRQLPFLTPSPQATPPLRQCTPA